MSRHYDGKSNLSPDAMKRNPGNNDPEFRASAASRLQKPVYRTLGNLLKGLGSSLNTVRLSKFCIDEPF